MPSPGGLYRLSFGVDLIGNYSLGVSFRGSQTQYQEDGSLNLGVPVKGSPFDLTVLPGRPDARQVSLAGPGVDTSTVGVRTEFTVTLRDRFGNQILAPGHGLAMFPYVMRVIIQGGGENVVTEGQCVLSPEQGAGMICKRTGDNPTSTVRCLAPAGWHQIHTALFPVSSSLLAPVVACCRPPCTLCAQCCPSSPVLPKSAPLDPSFRCLTMGPPRALLAPVAARN